MSAMPKKKGHSRKGAKARSERIHIKRRFLERFGLTVLTADLDHMVGQIRSSKAKFIKRQSHRVTHWDVLFKDKYYRVVYDSLRGELVTVLPLDPQTLAHLTAVEPLPDENHAATG